MAPEAAGAASVQGRHGARRQDGPVARASTRASVGGLKTGCCVTGFILAVAGPMHNPDTALRERINTLETDMRMILLVLSLIALATPSYAAPKSLEKKCHELVGNEDREGEGGRSHVGQLQVQRFSDCMMGAPR
jgi:hypothetical protein